MDDLFGITSKVERLLGKIMVKWRTGFLKKFSDNRIQEECPPRERSVSTDVYTVPDITNNDFG